MSSCLDVCEVREEVGGDTSCRRDDEGSLVCDACQERGKQIIQWNSSNERYNYTNESVHISEVSYFRG